MAAPTVQFTIADDRVTESSGLAMSRRHKGVAYTHNDSEDDARVFAVGSDGRTRAVLTLDGAEARDWEAIATGEDDDGGPALYIGDIGDNLGGAWSEIWVYRIAEPEDLEDQSVSYERFRFRYSDGARDAEALLVDPGTNRIYIVSKGARGGAVYAAPLRLSKSKVNVLRHPAGVARLRVRVRVQQAGQRAGSVDAAGSITGRVDHLHPGRPLVAVRQRGRAREGLAGTAAAGRPGLRAARGTAQPDADRDTVG